MLVSIYANQDSYVTNEEGYENSNFGTSSDLWVGEDPMGTCEYIGYFGFPLNNAIPSGDIITAVTFNFYVYGYYESAGGNYSLSSFTTPWNENTITWINKPSATNGVGSGRIPYTYGQWLTTDVHDIIPVLNSQRPNGYVSLKMSMYGPSAASINCGAYRAYLSVAHGTLSFQDRLAISTSQGTINKRVSNVMLAPLQGPINKQVLGIKMAIAQGAINKTII